MTHPLLFHSQADPQDFEQMLMVEPLLTVRDFRAGLSDEVADAGELLRNYEFNISQGIVQRVSRFFAALALMDERGEAPPARGEGGEGGEGGDSARGGVMGFGRKRNVLNLEKKPARRVDWVQQEKERIQMEAREAAAARKAAEQDAKVAALESQVAAAAALKATEQDKMAALEAKVAEMQALAALCGSAPVPGPPRPSAPHRTSAYSRTLRIYSPFEPSTRRQYSSNIIISASTEPPPPVAPPPRSKLRRGHGSVHEPRSLARPGRAAGQFWPMAACTVRLTRGRRQTREGRGWRGGRGGGCLRCLSWFGRALLFRFVKRY